MHDWSDQRYAKPVRFDAFAEASGRLQSRESTH